MSRGEAENTSAAIACIMVCQLRMLVCDWGFFGYKSYDLDILKCEPSKILIIDNEAAILMSNCNKDTTGNRHIIARRWHYVSR